MKKVITKNDIKLKEIADEIKKGKIFVFPTSTVYGIGTNAFNKEAVEKIYNIKRRDYKKALIVLINGYEMLNYITMPLNDIEKKLAETFWPGFLTLVLKKKDIIPDIVTASKDTVAVRYDANKLLNSIIDIANVPIVAPSANISNEPCINDIKDLSKMIYDSVDYVIDLGKINSNKESTIVKVEDNNVYILREGKIKKEDIFKCLKNFNVDFISYLEKNFNV